MKLLFSLFLLYFYYHSSQTSLNQPIKKEFSITSAIPIISLVYFLNPDSYSVIFGMLMVMGVMDIIYGWVTGDEYKYLLISLVIDVIFRVNLHLSGLLLVILFLTTIEFLFKSEDKLPLGGADAKVLLLISPYFDWFNLFYFLFFVFLISLIDLIIKNLLSKLKKDRDLKSSPILLWIAFLFYVF